MKLPALLLVSLRLSFLAVAAPKNAEPAPAAATDPYAAFATAEDFWNHVEKLREKPTVQPHSREEYLAILKGWFAAQKDGAEAFLKKYPGHAHRYAAQLMTIQAGRQLARIPGAEPEAKPDAAEPTAQLDAIIAAPDAPEDVKSEAAFVRAMAFADQIDTAKPETASAFFKAAEDFLAKYGAHPLAAKMREVQLERASDVQSPEAEALLRKFAADQDARVAEGAQRQLAQRKMMQELRTKPLPLKFTAADGQPVDLENLRGKVVLLDFWASWCGPCIAEMPNVVATYTKLHDKGFEIIGISLDQEKEAMDGALKKHGMTWPQYFDGLAWKNPIVTAFGITAIPAAWLIDKKGMLRETGVRGEALGAGVEKLLAE